MNSPVLKSCLQQPPTLLSSTGVGILQQVAELPVVFRSVTLRKSVGIYSSYKECLEFFYPRLSDGGLLLLDEYNDPPWPGCNKAVDQFLAEKPEKLEAIVLDNYQKFYFIKE